MPFGEGRWGFGDMGHREVGLSGLIGDDAHISSRHLFPNCPNLKTLGKEITFWFCGPEKEGKGPRLGLSVGDVPTWEGDRPVNPGRRGKVIQSSGCLGEALACPVHSSPPPPWWEEGSLGFGNTPQKSPGAGSWETSSLPRTALCRPRSCRGQGILLRPDCRRTPPTHPVVTAPR